VRKEITFTAVSHMDEVLKLALVRDPYESNEN
jgi:ATP-dependent Lon protease